MYAPLPEFDPANDPTGLVWHGFDCSCDRCVSVVCRSRTTVTVPNGTKRWPCPCCGAAWEPVIDGVNNPTEWSMTHIPTTSEIVP